MTVVGKAESRLEYSETCDCGSRTRSPQMGSSMVLKRNKYELFAMLSVALTVVGGFVAVIFSRMWLVYIVMACCVISCVAAVACALTSKRPE